MLRSFPKFVFISRQSEPFAPNEISVAVKSYQNEVPVIRNEHLSVTAEIATDLFRVDNRINFIAG